MIGAVMLVVLLCAYVASKGGLRNLARGRLYKSGTGWCVWRWTDTQSEYILRLHVVKTPWCAICLHWINTPDFEPWLHDHPVSFLSVILRGGYTELRHTKKKGLHRKLNSWFNFMRASQNDRHRIILVRKNTLTLCFMGPKAREWGFHVGDLLQPRPTALGPAGWLYWKDYYARLKAGQDLRCGPLGLFDRVLQGHYTAGSFAALAGAPIGTCTDVDTRLIDTAPADDFVAEELTGPRDA
jgi:hypothetical protein